MIPLLRYNPAEAVQASTRCIAYAQDIMGPMVFFSQSLLLQEILFDIYLTADTCLISGMLAPQCGIVSFQLFPILNLHLNFFKVFKNLFVLVTTL